MHGHGSTIAERVSFDVFWEKTKSSRANIRRLGSEDRNDVRDAEREEL